MTPTLIPPALDSAPPPIWVGALGPRMTQMAAEVADGVLVHPFNSERFLRTITQPRVAAGLAVAGRDRSTFTVGVDVIACVYENEEQRRVT
jgi:alkanesulfonate monooxygenase SsuD/methylene tetrahydromethanopterin reductase-like flavin-dependent oxidoreductase (luciferase family)